MQMPPDDVVDRENRVSLRREGQIISNALLASAGGLHLPLIAQFQEHLTKLAA